MEEDDVNQPKRWKGLCVMGQFTPEEVLAYRGDRDSFFTVGFFTLSVPMNDSRYRVFAKSMSCYRCGLVGTEMRLEYSNHPRGWIEPHFNLYGYKDGKPVMMTQDHVVPKSKGGSDEDDNLVTMCQPCNEKKGCKL